MKMQQSQIVLGLTLDNGLLTAVEVKRSHDSIRILKKLAAPLTLDPLRDEPELAGREIRNLLDQAQISTKRCAAGIPSSWALTVHTKLPAIDEQDIAGLLEIEAERGFPCNPDELQISSRIYKTPAGDQFASIIGVPRAYLERFEAVLVAAQLKPVSFSFGITVLPDADKGAVTVEISDSKVNLLIATSGGVTALRTIDSAFDSEGAERHVQADVLARELRITLGRIPAELRSGITDLNIFGEHRFAEQLLSDFQTRGRILGMNSRHFTSYQGLHHGLKIENAPVSSAASLGAQYLSDETNSFEFLPPKPTFWEQLSSKYSSRRLAYAGAAAAILLLMAASVFGFQQMQYSKYASEWDAMKTKVRELEDVQSNVRKFRPWHEQNLTTLNIMRRLTEAFPEEGIVSAKVIEIRNGTISCVGTARDNPSLLKTIDQLRGFEEVRDLRVDQIRGNSPIQFTFNFQWAGAASHEN